MKVIDRPLYMKKLLEFRDTSFIKIVTGIRRCGKSTLLALFVEHLRQTGIGQEHIIQMNFESIKYREVSDYLSLYDYVSKRIPPQGKTYLIFDEIQMVQSWQKAVDSFLVDYDVDIYITGSNAWLLSSEFSTLLSGRYVEIRMLPLSFAEFLDFYSFDAAVSMDEKFQTFLKFGGMPAIRELGFQEQRINDVLEGIYSTVILKDVMQRNKIADQALLQRLVVFLADSIGSVTSPNSIGRYLAGQGDIDEGKRRVNPASKTVENYIGMLEKSFIFYGAGRYDIRGKQLLKTLGKYYIVDTGIRNMLLGYRDVDRGHVLENVVFLELLRRDYRVTVGKIGDKEVDFVAERPDEKKYIQVTETMLGEETRERELAPLRSIPDHYEKIVLSMDRSYVKSYEGIQAVHITDFLLDGD